MATSSPVNLKAQPHWIVTLDSGKVFIGNPSWLYNSGDLPNTPVRASDPFISDWQLLKQYCAEQGTRIKSLSLYVPNTGRIAAPSDKGAYGFFETHRSQQSTARWFVEDMSICWPEWEKGKLIIHVHKIKANGVLEHWRRSKWLPCMIGEPEANLASKDEGEHVGSVR